ncbi:MAG: tRNA glutamyl-Q(34) synthetase GluQRS [Actinobacteria bacterium]|nr:tRNA glutamyl-Q(34) synthetase GluQRS [Actinomycetota bacterium]
MRGRFAPSPTGALHVGNLRTALIAWLSARAQGGELIVRMEDLDPVTSSPRHEAGQLADLAALGLAADGPVVRQSDRFDLHRAAVADLAARDLVYPCYCTRREIREAAAAPHGDPLPDGAYPGTCRHLSARERSQRERDGRPAALRLRADGRRVSVVDRVAGPTTGVVDDVVLVRNDGVPAYNLAVVVDDHLQGVTEVVRGDDLLSSTPRQVHLQQLLGFATPAYAHVPLVVGVDGSRLAKRHGATTLAELAERGMAPATLLAVLGASLGLCRPDETVTVADLATRFSFDSLPRVAWTFSADAVIDAAGLPR